MTCTCGGLRIIGDVHADFNALKLLTRRHQNSIQIGDLGLGFDRDRWLNEVLDDQEGLRFFRGNHDQPDACKTHPKHLASGMHDERFFVVGGGYSIDHEIRKRKNWGWWADEEHSATELAALVDEFERRKPRLVISHEGPSAVTDAMFAPKWKFRSATAQALDAMLETHQPDLWLFGHWHRNRDLRMGKTRFICVGEKETKDIHLPGCPAFERETRTTVEQIGRRLAKLKRSGA
jgi:predicted phosphodiesterase